MNPTTAPNRFDAPRQQVSSDFKALALHMSECKRSRSRFFTLQNVLQTCHALTAPRLVTTGVLLVVCSAGMVALALA